MSYILGIVSQKGGVGKSTLARLFAVELAKEVVDLRARVARLESLISKLIDV